ncbi:uncharacterized protein LOC144579746 isoform X1 [Callithrix jacchus]
MPEAGLGTFLPIKDDGQTCLSPVTGAVATSPIYRKGASPSADLRSASWGCPALGAPHSLPSVPPGFVHLLLPWAQTLRCQSCLQPSFCLVHSDYCWAPLCSLLLCHAAARKLRRRKKADSVLLGPCCHLKPAVPEEEGLQTSGKC